MLSVGLRAHEDEWFAPFAELVLRRAPGDDHRDHAGGGQLALPPARARAPRAARAQLGAGRRPRHGRRAAPGGAGTWRRLRDGRGTRRGGGAAGGGTRQRRGRRGGGPSERGLRRGCRGRWRLDRGGGRVARHAPAGRADEGPDRAPRRGGGDGGVADRPAAAHPLSRALARGAGGLRGHVRGQRPGSPSA